MKKQSANRRKLNKPDLNRYPKVWDRQRVEAVIAHYENQTDDQAVAEDQAAYDSTNSTMIQVPLKLVPAVLKVLARYAG